MTGSEFACLLLLVVIVFSVGCWIGACVVWLVEFWRNDRPRILRTLDEKTPVRKP